MESRSHVTGSMQTPHGYMVSSADGLVGPGFISTSHDAPSRTRERYNRTGVLLLDMIFHGVLDLQIVYIAAVTVLGLVGDTFLRMGGSNCGVWCCHE